MDQEFKVGSQVTFMPYEKRYKAVVKEVLTNHFHKGDLIYYLRTNPDHLSNRQLAEGVITYTSPENIEESRYFKPFTRTIN